MIYNQIVTWTAFAILAMFSSIILKSLDKRHGGLFSQLELDLKRIYYHIFLVMHGIIPWIIYIKNTICIHVGQKVFNAGDKSGAQKVWQRAEQPSSQRSPLTLTLILSS